MKIVMFGDSITDMRHSREEQGSVFSYGSGYVFFVAGELLSENFDKYEIVNRGISGNRIVDLYARIKADVWNLHPDVLSILIGVNDVWHEIDSQNGVESDRYERIYRTIIKETQEKLPDCKIILIEPFVLKGSATEEKYDRFIQVKEYAGKVKAIAKDFNLPFVSLQEKFDEASSRYGVSKYLYDGVPPPVAGAKFIVDEWLKIFRTEIDVKNSEV